MWALPSHNNFVLNPNALTSRAPSNHERYSTGNWKLEHLNRGTEQSTFNNWFTVPTYLPCQPIYRANRFTVTTDLPWQLIYRANLFTVPTDLQWQPIYRANRFTVPTYLPCQPIYRANRFTVPTDLPGVNTFPDTHI